MSMSATNSSSTLEKAIALLWELYAEPDGLTASELARRIDIHRTGFYRLIRPFLRTQFVRRDDRRRYYLGFGITALARAVAQPIEGLIAAPIQALANKTNVSVIVVTDTDGILVTISSAKPETPGMHVTVPPGYVHNDNPVADLAVRSLRPPSPEDSADLRKVREQGFASNRSGRIATVIAVPMRLQIVGGETCLLLSSAEPFDIDAVFSAMVETRESILTGINRT